MPIVKGDGAAGKAAIYDWEREVRAGPGARAPARRPPRVRRHLLPPACGRLTRSRRARRSRATTRRPSRSTSTRSGRKKWPGDATTRWASRSGRRPRPATLRRYALSSPRGCLWTTQTATTHRPRCTMPPARAARRQWMRCSPAAPTPTPATGTCAPRCTGLRPTAPRPSCARSFRRGPT